MLVIFTLYSFDCFMLVLNQFVTNPIQSIQQTFTILFQCYKINSLFSFFNFSSSTCFLHLVSPILVPPSCFLHLVSFMFFPILIFQFFLIFHIFTCRLPFTVSQSYLISRISTIMLCLFYFPNLILMSYFPYPVYFLLFLTSCLLSSVSHKMLFIFLYFRNPIKRFLFPNCVSIIN